MNVREPLRLSLDLRIQLPRFSLSTQFLVILTCSASRFAAWILETHTIFPWPRITPAGLPPAPHSSLPFPASKYIEYSLHLPVSCTSPLTPSSTMSPANIPSAHSTLALLLSLATYLTPSPTVNNLTHGKHTPGCTADVTDLHTDLQGDPVAQADSSITETTDSEMALEHVHRLGTLLVRLNF